MLGEKIQGLVCESMSIHEMSQKSEEKISRPFDAAGCLEEVEPNLHVFTIILEEEGRSADSDCCYLST